MTVLAQLTFSILRRLNLLDSLSDKIFIKLQFRARTGSRLNLKNPKTFNEKIQWLKLYDQQANYHNLADKYAVRDYIARQVGSQYLVPILGIYQNFDEINFNTLPNQFVLKCTHDSGSAVICLNKANFDIVAAREKIGRALKKNYFYAGREWAYKDILPRIICEEYLFDGRNDQLIDYKLMCFNGRVEFSLACCERGSNNGVTIDLYDVNWQKMSVKREAPNSQNGVVKPKNYDQMVSVAQKIAQNFSFIRVDFYAIDEKLYIGELTLYPANGLGQFSPKKYDRIFGDKLILPLESLSRNIIFQKDSKKDII